MILVADASFAAKVLLDEEDRDVAVSWWADAGVTWVAPALVGAEVESALHVHHRAHPRRFPETALAGASRTWSAMLDGIALHAVDAELVALARELVGEVGPVRGADACYLAVAQQFEPDEVTLGSFDRQQRRAASRAGVAVAPA